MIEITLLPTTQVGKPKIAIVIGSVIVAEPDATRGVWWEEPDNPNRTNNMYAIVETRDIDEFTDVIYKLNENSTRPLSSRYRDILVTKIKYFRFQDNIIEYMKF